MQFCPKCDAQLAHTQTGDYECDDCGWRGRRGSALLRQHNIDKINEAAKNWRRPENFRI
jgi:Zn-finger nucleic acid-binding protein